MLNFFSYSRILQDLKWKSVDSDSSPLVLDSDSKDSDSEPEDSDLIDSTTSLLPLDNCWCSGMTWIMKHIYGAYLCVVLLTNFVPTRTQITSNVQSVNKPGRCRITIGRTYHLHRLKIPELDSSSSSTHSSHLWWHNSVMLSLTVKKVKVNSTLLPMTAHLTLPDLELLGEYTTKSMTRSQCITRYSYIPSLWASPPFHQYRVILLGDKHR